MRCPRLLAGLLAAAATVVLAVPALASTASAAPPPATPNAPSSTASSYNGLALTPPMGWNDWSYYQCNIDEKLIVDQAKALVSTGLAAKGYDTVTVDDCWMGMQRAADGSLVSDAKTFPHGMTWLGQQIHALGLKFGIYEDAGTQTCGGYPGSWGHIEQDMNTFAAWQVDYVKMDGCNVPDVDGQTTEQTYAQVYQQISDALQNTGRDMVFSDSAPAYFQGTPQWHSVISLSSRIANLWREGADTALGQQSAAQKWSAIAYNYGYNVGLGRYAGPGHWNDPDFLLTGDDGLTTTEMQSQMSLWAVMAAPLISSTDLTKLSPAALRILGNERIIAVDQDRLGKQGTLVARGSGYDVIAKPLADGDVAVVLFNKTTAARTISTTAATAGLAAGSPYRLTDLVTGRSTSSSGIIAADVAAHGTVMYRVHRYATGQLAPQVSLHVSHGTVQSGRPTRLTVTMSNDGPIAMHAADLTLDAPTGWTVQPRAQHFGGIAAGRSVTATFAATGPAARPGTDVASFTASVHYTSNGGGAVVSGPIDIVRTVPYPSLAAAFDNVGITAQSDPKPGNFDGDGNSFSADQLAARGVTPGSTVTAQGARFTWPDVAAGTPDNVVADGQVVTMSGSGQQLAFLGSEAGDVQGTVTVRYTDGSSSTGQLGFPNWSFSDADEFGATVAVSTMGRNTQAGYADSAYAYRVFYNSIPLDAGRTIASVTLPTAAQIHLFAMAVQ